MNSATRVGRGGDHQISPLLNGGIAESYFLFIGGIAKYARSFLPKFLVPPLPELMDAP